MSVTPVLGRDSLIPYSLLGCSAGLGYDSTIPDAPDAESHPLTKTLAEKVSKYVDQYLEAMEKVIYFIH